jgi:hypothetical protein
LKKEGQKSPEYEVVMELGIGVEVISEEELILIEGVMADIIRAVLDNEAVGGE